MSRRDKKFKPFPLSRGSANVRIGRLNLIPMWAAAFGLLAMSLAGAVTPTMGARERDLLVHVPGSLRVDPSGRALDGGEMHRLESGEILLGGDGAALALVSATPGKVLASIGAGSRMEIDGLPIFVAGPWTIAPWGDGSKSLVHYSGPPRPHGLRALMQQDEREPTVHQLRRKVASPTSPPAESEQP